jgi:hypothetical protein
MADHAEPPVEYVDRLREMCAALDNVAEIEAWTGTSWRTGGVTFAHILQIDRGWPPKYASVFETDGPATVLTFQSDESEALAAVGPPFYRPPWRPGIVGLRLSATTDWDEVAELVLDSHRLCAGDGA